MLTVEIEDNLTPLLTDVASVVQQNLQWGVKAVTEVLTEEMQVTAPLGRHFSFSGTMQPGGTLRRSLRFDVGDLGAVLMGADYGKYVIGGTRPHTIAARNASALAFFWERLGRTFVGPSVHHPGTRANDFRSKALDLAFESGELTRIFDAILGATIAGVAAGG